MLDRAQLKPSLRQLIRQYMELESRLISDEEIDLIAHQTGMVDVVAYTIMACDLKVELSATPLTTERM